MKRLGVLAFHGDVIEHIEASKKAAKNLHLNLEIIEVRTRKQLKGLDGLIIPGGESTTIQKLSQRVGIWEDIKKIKNIFGTCAGAIMLAKTVYHKIEDQKTLELMDIVIDRNAYGKQAQSFEKNIQTFLGKIKAVFIRAPKIISVGKKVKVLALEKGEILACEQQNSQYLLATSFHPELTTTLFHEYFLKKI